MQKNILLTLSACSLFVLTSCSKLGVLTADNFTVTPNPLETQSGVVPATIDGRFPAKYMKRKAVVTVVPELRYGNGQIVKGKGATFQGEKVMGNDQSISYKMGGRYTMKTKFAYLPEMQNSQMFLTFYAKIGKKVMNVPTVKVADGVIATSELYKKTLMSGGPCLATDSFQRIRKEKQEANVKFLINQANLRKSELKGNSIAEFVNMLRKINKDREKYLLSNVEIKAYASPEGGFEFNDKLAGKRQNSSEKYVKGQLKKAGVKTFVDAKYTAQDWEGFQELVKASNIQDKEVILRVLSMYKDPQERETQIRNMGYAFKELAIGILPELRRARMIINYNIVGRSDEQIKELYAKEATKLSVEEMLYAATLTDKMAEKEDIYKKTAEYYDKDYRALNNLAVIAMQQGKYEEANTYLAQALRKNSNAPEVFANYGILALKDGNLTEAENNIAKAIDAPALGLALGNLNIAKGNYAQAEQNFDGVMCNSAALAQILNKNYAAAIATLKSIKSPDAMTSYLTAIVYARQGNTTEAAEALRNAIQKDPQLATYAARDLELSRVNK